MANPFWLENTGVFRAVSRVLARWAVERRLAIIFLSIAATVAGFWSAAQNSFDYDLKDLLGGRPDAFEKYREFVEVFGPDDDILILQPIAGIGSQAFRTAFRVKAAVASIPGVLKVVDLAGAVGIPGEEKLRWLEERSRHFVRKLQEIRASRLLRGLFVSPDETWMTTIVRPKPLEGPAKHELVRTIKKTVENEFGPGTARFCGYPVFAESYVTHMIKGNSVFIVLSILVALLISVVLFRSPALVAAVAAVVLLPAVWTHGAFAALGYKASLFSTLLTPIVLFVSLSLSIQVIARFRLFDIPGPGGTPPIRARVIEKTLEDCFPPGFMCALTTVIGFASQILSPITGIRAFGVLSSLGCGFAFVSSTVLLPVFLGFLVGGKSGAGSRMPSNSGFERKFGRALARMQAAPRTAFNVAVLGTAALSFGISFLNVGSDPLSTLPQNDPAVLDHRFFQENYGFGARQISLFLKAGTEDFRSFEIFRVLRVAEERIASAPEVAAIVSPLEIVREVRREIFGEAGANPRNPGELDKAFRLAEGQAEELLQAFFNPPYLDRARMIVGLRSGMAPDVEAASRRLEGLLNELGSGTFTASGTGRMHLSALMENEALLLEVQSFTSSLAGILFVLLVGFRSFQALFIGFIANFLPLVAALGILGWLGVPLDPVSAMVPCICLGIIVDDTIHIIHEMGQEERKGHGPQRSRICLMLRLGWAVVSISLILILGLGILCFSDFGPIRRFGIYSVMAMTLGIFYDLFLTPSMLILFRKTGGHSTS